MIWSLKAPTGAPGAPRRPRSWVAPLATLVATAALILASAFGTASRPEPAAHGDRGQVASAAADRSLGSR